MIKNLLAENVYTWKKAEVPHVGWLTGVPPTGKKSSAIVVEFTDPRHANTAIDEGTIWDSMLLNTVLYDRAARIRRCYNCQQYGHIGTICSNPASCGYCAGGHETRGCPQRTEPGDQVRKCANCGGPHAAWYKKCEKYEAEAAKIMESCQRRQRHHQIPPYLQDFDMDTEGSDSRSRQLSSSSSGGRNSAPAKTGSGGQTNTNVGAGGIAGTHPIRTTRSRTTQAEPAEETTEDSEGGAPCGDPPPGPEPMRMEIDQLTSDSQTDSILTTLPPTETTERPPVLIDLL